MAITIYYCLLLQLKTKPYSDARKRNRALKKSAINTATQTGRSNNTAIVANNGTILTKEAARPSKKLTAKAAKKLLRKANIHRIHELEDAAAIGTIESNTDNHSMLDSKLVDRKLAKKQSKQQQKANQMQ